MLRYISADRIYPVERPSIDHGVIALTADGTIQAILTPQEAQDQEITAIEHYPGVIVPGFVNTHCHLELSHLLGQIQEKTGLTEFIKGILALREQPVEDIVSAMEKADQEMYDNGIVAVGDISNKLISKEIKLKSKIYYHTFVEVFGFNAPAEKTIVSGIELKLAFAPLKASIVPHAPYSVSSALFQKIAEVNGATDPISIHNQETQGENELFELGTGRFADFFAELGIAQSEAHGQGKNALAYHLPQLSRQANTLLVHNTFTSKSDLENSKKIHQQVFWCLCPNANLYIEDTLPNVAFFAAEGLKVTLGTDSLASNHQLNILAEMKTLQDQKQIPFDTLLEWATRNGAEFLGIATTYGSLTPGKRPGILLLNLSDGDTIPENAAIQRLF
ncbi:MAG: amidohydrolase family protein [Pedobacter sp.]|nr:amidohydrolase family protein [Pedobacter sp.]MDQ8052915.1 amidohydrolase family protein [Pedobacter sp.]